MVLRRSRRGGFTLLEMILATAIAAMLMAALYVSMDIQLRLAEAGREAVETGTLARQILVRMSQDIAGSLTPITATKVAAAATSTAAAATGDDTGGSFGSVTPLNGGVEGEMDVLTVFASKVPPRAGATDSEGQSLVTSDMRRVSYWLTADGGLARQEFYRVTADDDSSQMPPNVDNEQKYVIAPEVVGLGFRYFDGTTWADSWYGSTVGADEITPIGPPRAIEITLTIRLPDTGDAGVEKTKTYRHVVAIGAANAQPVMTGDEATTTPSTTTGATP